MPRIQIFLPGDEVLSHDLAEETVRIGRTADNDLQIDDPSVSSHHGEILFRDGVYVLRDLGSTNGTTLNDAPVTESQISEGDRIVFGHIDALFGEEISPAVAAATTPDIESHPKESPMPSGLSARPVDFVSTSPIPKTESSKDPVRLAALAVAILSILVSAAAIACAALLIETPTFPTP